MTTQTHPVDALSDDELFALMARVDLSGFPAQIENVWRVERIRFRQTLRQIPPATAGNDALLDLGSSRVWLPFYQELLGYRRIVLNTSYPDSGFVADDLTVRGSVPSEVSVSVFDVEREEFPHNDESFDVVLCLEVLEHLAIDPMAMMAEVNRVLKPGGAFVLTTPNAVRSSNLVNMLLGEHPLGWAHYNGFDTNRHNREYTPAETDRLLRAAGMAPIELTTFGHKRRGFHRDLLAAIVGGMIWPIRSCPRRWRKDVILAVSEKTTAVMDRRPSWLYFDMAERRISTQRAASHLSDTGPLATAHI